MIEYGEFVRRRRDLWHSFESTLKEARRAPQAIDYPALERLALLYRKILHDHSLAAERFAGTAAARRLEALALAGTHWLQREEPAAGAGFFGFFVRTFPTALRRQFANLALCVALFAVTSLLGLFVATVRPALGMHLLGPAAVDGLEHGHLWTEHLFSVMPASVASSSIATNNMSVAITAWAGGALAGIGALYIVILNGLMLGAIVGVTAHYGMADALLTFVSAHGPLEITLILTTAAAGLGMGRAVIEAGDRPRRVVLQEAGRDALVVLLGCLPWFLLLGVVESFISPSPLLPPAFKLALGLCLLGLFAAVAAGRGRPREKP